MGSFRETRQNAANGNSGVATVLIDRLVDNLAAGKGILLHHGAILHTGASGTYQGRFEITDGVTTNPIGGTGIAGFEAAPVHFGGLWIPPGWSVVFVPLTSGGSNTYRGAVFWSPLP